MRTDITYSGYLTEEQLKEVDRRIADHENGVGRTYTWEEAVERAQNAAKKTNKSN